ncbi:MAG: HIRAN domain-containing protein [Propionicimonas sp.]|uniref:HIRAN domain-containing protein n=1 Tax=Propionicimonas sp. TaxID=1955623 RepID=UPI003D0DF236
MTPFLIAVAVVALIVIIWSRNRKRTAPEVRGADAVGIASTAGQPEPDDTWLPVVGTSYHSAIDYTGDGPVEVRLKREPNNTHDANAIGAWIGNRKLGYIPHRIAVRYAPVIDAAGGTIRVPGYCRHGSIDVRPDGLTTAPLPADRRPVRAWGWTVYSCEVEGEFMNRGGLESAYSAAGVPVTESGVELNDVPALLLESADGSGFLDVLINGRVVGYLAEGEAALYAPIIRSLRSRGQALEVSARLWARRGERLRGRVTLLMPRADEVEPPSPLPNDPYVVLPATSSMQVSGEEAHQDVLAPLLTGRTSASVVATLHSAEIQRARSAVAVVEVRVGGAVVGQLSSTSSANTIDLIRACEAAGRIPVAHGTITGNSLKVEMSVRTAKTADVSDRWLAEVLNPTAVRPAFASPSPENNPGMVGRPPAATTGSDHDPTSYWN